MESVSVNKFRDNLKKFMEQVVSKHVPLKVTRRGGDDFVVVSADDWERQQETLFILQNKNLMGQIVDSARSNETGSGYTPSGEEMDEVTGI